MTMHLVGPALTMTGKKKGKIKFRNSDEARKARQLDHDWKELQKKWGIDQEEKKRSRAMRAEPLVYKLNAPVGRSTSTHIPSRVTAGGSTAPVHREYTGDKIIGIATLHKSNAVPVFSQDEAVEISRMRRG